MKMRMKRIMGLFLALVMSIGCLSLNPIASYADDADPNTFNINKGNVNITQSGIYTIEGTGQPTSNTISVTGSNIKAKIILKNVNIDVSNQDEQQAFLAKNNDQFNVHLTIILEGTNSLKSGDHRAGLTWNNSDNNSTLEIEGDGSLTATGGWAGAGIGGDYGGLGKNITITGGTVTATGGTFGAGIGGGGGGSGKNIKITGGTVTATGGWAGVGIGGGDAGSGRNITITGGTVKASSISTTPTDGKGNNVYLFKLKNQDSVNEVTVDSGTANAKTFTRAGNHPDRDTAFYLYLTGKNHDLDTSKKKYKAEWNNTTNTFTTKFDPNDVKSMMVTTQPSKLSYTEDDPLDLSGLVVTLTDDQGKTKEVKPTDFTANNINADPENGAVLKLGHNEKPVTLKRGNLTATTDALQVKQRVFDPTRVTSRTITHQPKLSYTEGERLDLTGLVVTLTDYQDLRKEVPFAQFERYGINAYPADKTFLKVADHNGKPVKLVIYRPGTGIQSWSAQAGVLMVKPRVFDSTHVNSMSVTAQPTKLKYTEGETLDLTGLEVTLEDANHVKKVVTPAEFEANGIKATPKNGAKLALTDGGKPVTLKRGNLTATTNDLKVAKLNPTSMSVTSQPTKLKYTEGETLDLTGLEVTLEDDNHVKKVVTPAEFEANGIKAAPKNGKKLELTDGGNPVKLTRGNLAAETTDALQVKAKVFNPSSGSGSTGGSSAGSAAGAGVNDDAPTTVDKGELNIQIDSAESDYKSGYAGNGSGAAVKQAADALDEALTQAKRVAANPNATQTQVDAATRRLADARKALTDARKAQPKKRAGMLPKTGESASFAGLLAALGFSIAGLAILRKKKMMEENIK